MGKIIKKPFMLLMLIAIFSMALSGAVFAKDQSNKTQDKKYDRYHAKFNIDAATAVALIVKGLNLNIDHIRFIKAPKASDYFTKVKDNAWYAEHFIIAQHTGLGLPQYINPSAKVTKEQFSQWLFGALSNKGEFTWIEIYMEIADADQVTKGYMYSIQKLLIAKIATLDSKQKFYPKENITRGEALAMIGKTKSFIKNATPVIQPETPVVTDVKLTPDKLSDDVTRVTLTAMAPHPGYGFEVSSIAFANGEAIINYRVIEPDPDKFYAQVITELKLVTYISSQYKPVLGSSETVPFTK
ncbi:S-layer homology domain-containing protein [Cohnella sp.]|uniref:S-layer homology domain-containing protein n=1 Tax=Cohnella sp. TaxID=1883426 RepID=UPI0035669ABF